MRALVAAQKGLGQGKQQVIGRADGVQEELGAIHWTGLRVDITRRPEVEDDQRATRGGRLVGAVDIQRATGSRARAP